MLSSLTRDSRTVGARTAGPGDSARQVPCCLAGLGLGDVFPEVNLESADASGRQLLAFDERRSQTVIAGAFGSASRSPWMGDGTIEPALVWNSNITRLHWGERTLRHLLSSAHEQHFGHASRAPSRER